MYLKRTNSTDPDFQILVNRLNEYLLQQYGGLQDFYSQFNKIDNIPNVVVIYQEENPVACGCFKKWDERTVELKRMFVADEYRGRGFGKAVVSELENWAVELGYIRMVLEHGNRQPEANQLYQHLGFEIIPNYGQYIGMEETSICREKTFSGLPNN
jgi:GNAT superfamily N-acetyltransferase